MPTEAAPLGSSGHRPRHSGPPHPRPLVVLGEPQAGPGMGALLRDHRHPVDVSGVANGDDRHRPDPEAARSHDPQGDLEAGVLYLHRFLRPFRHQAREGKKEKARRGRLAARGPHLHEFAPISVGAFFCTKKCPGRSPG